MTNEGVATRAGVRRVEFDPVGVTVQFDDGTSARFNRFWLRDNCPSLGDREALTRPCSIADLDESLAVKRAEVVDGALVVAFDDGLVERFPASLLRAAGPPSRGAAGPSWRAWRAGHEPERFELALLVEGTEAHHALLEALASDGFALVSGLGPEDTDRLAALLGPIRETDFGRIFDIVTEPDPFTPSQSEEALDPHTDDPYRYAPPGVSILHCVSPCGGEGGASTIVDGFAVADDIRASDPASFEVLSSARIPYVHRRATDVDQGAAIHLRAEAPVIAVDADGEVCGIRFHERSMAPLPTTGDEVEPIYRALRGFARRVLNGDFAYHRRLGPGEAIVYDNQRVLHGRAAITAGGGRRHLRLCTMDRDQVHSRLRRFRERTGTGTEADSLPAGNLA